MNRNEILNHRDQILRERRTQRRLGAATHESEAIAAARARLALRYIARADLARFGACHPHLQKLLARSF